MATDTFIPEGTDVAVLPELVAPAVATLRRHARGWDDYVSLCEALGLEAEE